MLIGDKNKYTQYLELTMGHSVLKFINAGFCLQMVAFTTNVKKIRKAAIMP